MTKFQPEVALRILSDKQQRLYDEAWTALRKSLWAGVSTPGWYRGKTKKERTAQSLIREKDREFQEKNDQADKMYDVIHFLRDEVERVNSDEVPR